MPKFEYLRTSFPDDVELNALGENGWELACMYHNTYVFKRVKSDHERQTFFGNEMPQYLSSMNPIINYSSEQ